MHPSRTFRYSLQPFLNHLSRAHQAATRRWDGDDSPLTTASGRDLCPGHVRQASGAEAVSVGVLNLQPQGAEGRRKVVVASQNPSKVRAASEVFRRTFPDTPWVFESFRADSGVSQQPWGDEETLRGAENRARHAASCSESADFIVAIEGGVQRCTFSSGERAVEVSDVGRGWEGDEAWREKTREEGEGESHLVCFAWVVVLSKEEGKDGVGRAKTAAFMLPPPITQLVEGGMELGDADDQLFGRKGGGKRNGTVGVLTNNGITRQMYMEHAIHLALIPFMNPELYRCNH